MVTHGHEHCPHCGVELQGDEPLCPSCSGALFGVARRQSKTEIAKETARCRLCIPNQKWKIVHSLSSRNPLFALHEMVLQNVVPNLLDYSPTHPRYWV